MSTLTIRKVDEDVKRRLQIRAAQNGRSMEAEVRAILGDAVQADRTGSDDDALLEALKDFRRLTGGVDLPLPPRAETSDHRIPDFT